LNKKRRAPRGETRHVEKKQGSTGRRPGTRSRAVIGSSSRARRDDGLRITQGGKGNAIQERPCPGRGKRGGEAPGVEDKGGATGDALPSKRETDSRGGGLLRVAIERKMWSPAGTGGTRDANLPTLGRAGTRYDLKTASVHRESTITATDNTKGKGGGKKQSRTEDREGGIKKRASVEHDKTPRRLSKREKARRQEEEHTKGDPQKLEMMKGETTGASTRARRLLDLGKPQKKKKAKKRG